MKASNFAYIRDALPFIGEGVLATVKLSIAAFIFALLIAYVVGILRTSRIPRWLELPLIGYLEIFRGTPLLVQLFLLYYGLPAIGIVLDSWTAAILGLALNSGAYMSEIVRSSILSVDRGQLEAAGALGYGRLQTLAYVVLPQAARVSVPPLTNALASLLKESSLVSILAITELTRVGNIIYSRTMAPFEIYLSIALLYLVLTSIVTLVSRRLEKVNSAWAAS